MKKNFKHVLLGTFIDESLKCANLTMTHLCNCLLYTSDAADD